MGQPVKGARRKWRPILEALQRPPQELRGKAGVCVTGQPEDSNGLCVQQGLGEWRGEDAPRSSHPAALPVLPSTAAPLEACGDFLQERQMFLDAAGY